MALSQIQCLNDNHVNWRSSESKPEFFYSEGQRLALEALVSKGPEAFYEILKKENIRDFLSELELKKILDTLETYDPGSEYFSQGDKDGEARSQDSDKDPVPSLEYWPEKSDRSIPQLDLGWPETIAYRGVTRATVYMQPPIDFQPHIKEVVRKMISQAQKVVAVVMDMFTDVDIFKDLLDAGFKRKVGIYIIVDESNLKYFLQMCERAQMHAGHLKNLRVRTTGGTEFFTRSSTHFKGALAQKFMFVDGDKAICGSYSFTWSAARTDRNVISVLSGQVVEAFDKQFQELYLTSRGVSLKSVPMDEEPEPEPMTLLSIAPANQDNVAMRKMFNPKYALVKAKSAELLGNSKTGNQENSTGQPKVAAKVKAMAEGHVLERPSSPPIHPGLLNLEKANMFDYLPTWVEADPEPGSEVLGYINIIDPKVKIIQPSQMNRIKVCDVSRANAQHRLQQKAQEAKRSHRQLEDPTVPPQREQPSPLVQNQVAPPHLVTSANEQTGGCPAEGKSLASLANTQRLGEPLDAQPHGQTGKGAVPPVPKPRKVPVTDVVSVKTAQMEGGNATVGEKTTQPLAPDGSTMTTLDKESQPLPGAGSGQADGPPETPMNGVEEEEEEAEEEDYLTVSDQENFSGSSANHSNRYSDASSLSEECFEVRGQPGLLRRTNSDFLLNGGSDSPRHWPHLHRKLSEPHMSRGTFLSPLGSPQMMLSLALAGEQQRRRKSDGVEEEIRCVLGTGRNLFAFPDGYSTCPSDAPQGSPLFCYGTKMPMSTGRGTQAGKSPEYGNGHRDGNRAKKNSPDPTGPPFWQSKTVSPNKNSPPGHFSQGRSGGPSRTTGTTRSPRQESHKAPEEIKTPLGIPLSKLSQSKHLKNKVGQWADSRRKHPGSVSRKDQ